jgi:hypothetical protein
MGNWWHDDKGNEKDGNLTTRGWQGIRKQWENEVGQQETWRGHQKRCQGTLGKACFFVYHFWINMNFWKCPNSL